MAQRWGTGSRCSTFSDLACQKFDTWFYDVPHPQRFGPSPSSLLELPGSAPLFNCVFFLVCCAFCQTGLKGESSLPYTLPLVLLPLSIRPTFRRHDSMPSSLVVYTRANPFAFFIIFLFDLLKGTCIYFLSIYIYSDIGHHKQKTCAMCLNCALKVTGLEPGPPSLSSTSHCTLSLTFSSKMRVSITYPWGTVQQELNRSFLVLTLDAIPGTQSVWFLLLHGDFFVFFLSQFWKVTWEVFRDDLDIGAWVAYYSRCDIYFLLYDAMLSFPLVMVQTILSATTDPSPEEPQL